MKRYPLLLKKFIFLMMVMGVLGAWLVSSDDADAVCCIQTNLDYGIWVNRPGEEICPNNHEVECDIRRRVVSAELVCEDIGCVGENIWGCKPTKYDRPVTVFANSCDEEVVTWKWEEFEALDCEYGDCFYTCNSIAKRSLADALCPPHGE